MNFSMNILLEVMSGKERWSWVEFKVGKSFNFSTMGKLHGHHRYNRKNFNGIDIKRTTKQSIKRDASYFLKLSTVHFFYFTIISSYPSK
jgi:hypothetical protein